MSRKFKPFWTGSRRAISLVEVVVGLALLGGLLVTIVVATGRTTRQIRQSKQRLAAIHALDDLLVAFESRTLALNGQSPGAFSKHPDFSWKAVPIPNSENKIFGTRLIQLNVLTTKDNSQAPLASVELVIPDDRLLEMELD